MVTAPARDLSGPDASDFVARASLLAETFAERAASHDADASFPFENFEDLSKIGLLSLTVPAALGGAGAGAQDTARVLGVIGKADPSTALVLSMHYIQHLVMARSTRWPGRCPASSPGRRSRASP
jgi:alkylation response protein AidB-like acyl-CoA dehydrogenase